MRWLPSLFAAEAIPSALITFVALVMFMQLGVSWEESTLWCGLLTLPWVLKSFVRKKVRDVQHFGTQARIAEACIFILLLALAASFTMGSSRRVLVFASLLLLCFACAWHELVARMFYENRLRSFWQNYYNSTKIFVSQSTVVLTYGVLILGVSAFEVMHHHRIHAIPYSWSRALFLLAAIYLWLMLFNLYALHPPRMKQRHHYRPISIGGAMMSELKFIDRIVWQPRGMVIVLCLFLLLLPQSLMFHTRAIYLLAPLAAGGLGVSLQWLSLAQGTVGVIAFSAGLGIGHWLWHHRQSGWLYASMVVPLGLSPLVYWLMTQQPPSTLFELCLATGVAQFCFGYGLNSCMVFVYAFSGNRYRSTINYLYIPLVALVMLVPMSASGWLVTRLGFPTFFAIDALTAIPAWLAGLLGWHLTDHYSLPHEE